MTMPSPPKFLGVPEPYRGLDTPVRFLAAYNGEPSDGENVEAKVHMDTEFAQLFWNVAARWGYELGMMDTAQGMSSKHEAMSAELEVLRENARNVASSERNLHEATTSLSQQRQQIIEMEKERGHLLGQLEIADFKLRRVMRRSPVLHLIKAADRTTAAIRRKLF